MESDPNKADWWEGDGQHFCLTRKGEYYTIWQRFHNGYEASDWDVLAHLPKEVMQ